MNRSLESLTTVAVIIVSLIYRNHERQKVGKGETVKTFLTKKEKIGIGILCILNPIIVDLIFYFGWKNQLPNKAKQINKMSIIIFLIEILLGILMAALIFSSK